MDTLISRVRVAALGFRDGWTQPHELRSSTSVDHLSTRSWDATDWLDRFINYGQRARSPRNHQRMD